MKRDNIKVKGHIGTWYVIDELVKYGRKLYLLESEQFGDNAACIIVDESCLVVLDEVYNGFADLDN